MMKFLTYCVLFFIAFVSIDSFAKWVPLLKNTGNDSIFFDPARVKKMGDDLHVVTLTNYQQAKMTKDYPMWSTMTHLSINCAKKTFMIHQVINYEEEDLQGKDHPMNFKYPKISPIPDTSTVSMIYSKICE